MSFLKSKGFKYLKNLVIGLGAAVVLLGALFKIQSWPYASEMLTLGLCVEAGLFAMLGLLGPDKDYYWEKLYPGLDSYGGELEGGPVKLGGGNTTDVVSNPRMEEQLDGMLGHLKTMSGSMSALKELQGTDFAAVNQSVKKMGAFYTNLNEAMANINESIDDTRVYKEQLAALNKNLSSLNSVYGGVLSAMSNIRN